MEEGNPNGQFPGIPMNPMYDQIPMNPVNDQFPGPFPVNDQFPGPFPVNDQFPGLFPENPMNPMFPGNPMNPMNDQIHMNPMFLGNPMNPMNDQIPMNDQLQASVALREQYYEARNLVAAAKNELNEFNDIPDVNDFVFLDNAQRALKEVEYALYFEPRMYATRKKDAIAYSQLRNNFGHWFTDRCRLVIGGDENCAAATFARNKRIIHDVIPPIPQQQPAAQPVPQQQD